jgi:glycosyltransferase involved in cell wall biosynthesis
MLGNKSTLAVEAAPMVSVLLIAFNQQHTVADAVRGVLAQTYTPLEIFLSDDCSSDGTFEVMRGIADAYQGPHKVIVRRNDANLGISAHLSQLAKLSRGELLVIAAGDDISVPHRCARLVDCWLRHDRRPDLIASDLADLDAQGRTHDQLSPTDLSTYHDVAMWLAERPYLVGAAHAWSRRLFDRFGEMMPGAMAEDRIMTFRAIMSGGACNLREPLVLYRRGGLSRKRRWKSVDDFIERIQQTNRFALAEVAQLQRDAQTAGVGLAMSEGLALKQARENFTRDMFDAPDMGNKLRVLANAKCVKWDFRVRMFLYSACPSVYEPFFALKRWRDERRHTA